jgi:anti-anti-sigma factor
MQQENTKSCLAIEQVGKVAVARFTREVVLSGQPAEAIGDQLIALLGEPGRHWLLLDFDRVRSLSSLMLAKLVALSRTAEAVGGRFALCNLHAVIAEILEVTRLNHVLNVYPGEAEALQSF